METWWLVDQSFWWGIVGGGVGTVLGVGGAVVGGYLVPRGRGYRGVMTGIVAVGVVGLLCAVAGVAAIADDQPYWVYDPLLLTGVVVYWVAVGLLPGIDMAYRTVLANRSTATNDLELRGRSAAGSWTSAVVREDWQPRGRYGKWVNPLIAAHGAVGSVIFVWGGWRFLSGAEFGGWFPGTMVGAGFLFSAGQLWLVKVMAIWSLSRNHEQQRLAAEELRRS